MHSSRSLMDTDLKDMELDSSPSSPTISPSREEPVDITADLIDFGGDVPTDVATTAVPDSTGATAESEVEDEEDGRPDLSEDFSCNLVFSRNVREIVSAHRVFKVVEVSPKSSSTVGLDDLAEQMKDKKSNLSTTSWGDQGLYEIQPHEPYAKDSKYTKIFFRTNLGNNVWNAQSTPGTTEMTAMGGIHGKRRILGKEFKEILHVPYSGYSQDGDGDKITFVPSLAQNVFGPEVDADRTVFFDDNLRGRTCTLTPSPDDENTCIMTVCGTMSNGSTDHHDDFRTDQDFRQGLLQGNRGYPTGSTYGTVWPV
ncbi:hypothetical protein I204_01230 [Kwoniella mangroviensis CBS 8886]|nr:hypothetical protein I204_01230 [Kwoniella mangroviensis CBS 8886]